MAPYSIPKFAYCPSFKRRNTMLVPILLMQTWVICPPIFGKVYGLLGVFGTRGCDGELDRVWKYRYMRMLGLKGYLVLFHACKINKH